MEKLVVQFPELAAWLIVILMTSCVGVVTWGFKKILLRLSEQDATMQANGERLQDIKDTFNSKLFDIHTVLGDHHARLRSLETLRDYVGPKP